MVQYSTATVDASFAAVADGTRRAMLERLGSGEATVTELALLAGITITGARKHVAILEQAGLVTTEKVGRTRICRLGPARLADVGDWLERFRLMWHERLDRFDQLLHEDTAPPTPKGTQP